MGLPLICGSRAQTAFLIYDRGRAFVPTIRPQACCNFADRRRSVANPLPRRTAGQLYICDASRVARGLPRIGAESPCLTFAPSELLHSLACAQAIALDRLARARADSYRTSS